MKWAAVWVFLRACLPAVYVVADAFRYGVSVHGDGTWKNQTPMDHINKAIQKIGEWSVTRNYNLLADAGLRILFALSLCATSAKYVPPNQPEPGTKTEETNNAKVEN